MSERKENIKRTLGITEYPWSSDEEIDVETLFRRPNEESDNSNGTNEEQRGLNSPVWEDEQRPTAMSHVQLWAMRNDENRAHEQEPQRSIASRSYENIERQPGVGLRRILMYKKLKRRNGSTFRHAFVSSLGSPMDLRSNVVKVRHGGGGRTTLPMLTGANIVSLARERTNAEPQPSTSRTSDTNASIQTSDIIIPNHLFRPAKITLLPPRTSATDIPSTSAVMSTESTPTSYTHSNTASERTRAITNLEQPTTAIQSMSGNNQSTQSLDPVSTPVNREETDRINNNVVARDILTEHDAASSQALVGTSAGGGGNRDFAFDIVMDGETLEPTDVALGSTAQPRPEPRKRKRDGDGYSTTEPDTVKGFNQCLLRLLECPVCLECMEPPISQCRRGHLVCARCRSRLSSCPVCRTSFSSVRNRAMEGVAELLRYPCRHGCGRDVMLRRRGAHEASCAARTYRCPAHTCHLRQALPLPELLDHLQKKHASLMKTGRTHKFSMKMNTKQHDTWLLLVDRDLFHLRIDIDIRSWGIVVYVAYIGPKCKANNFLYEVTVVGQNSERRLSYSRVTHSDLECSSLNVSRQDCFNLTLDQALNFLRIKSKNYEPDKYLDFIVQIINRDANDTKVENETP